MTPPRVFNPDCLTIAVGLDGMAVAAGTVDFAYVKSLRVEWDAEVKAPKAVIEFFRSHDPEVSRSIEENVRLARTLRWVEVRY